MLVIDSEYASDFAMGAVLSQLSADNHEVLHPVAFFSRKLEPAERNYDVHDKELLAIFNSLENWRHFLVGSPFVVPVVCDHRNLIFFQSSRILKTQEHICRYNSFSRSGKAQSITGLSTDLLRPAANTLSSSLEIMYTTYYILRVVPSSWSRALIWPVPFKPYHELPPHQPHRDK